MAKVTKLLLLYPDLPNQPLKPEELCYALTNILHGLKLKAMTFRAIKKRLLREGWKVKDQKGSHVHMIHPSKPGKITIPDHGNRDLKPGTVNAIWKQAGLAN